MTYAILGDWGTTRLRLWLLDHGVVRERRDGPGIGALTRSPAETLETAIAPWLDRTTIRQITLCGMAGSRGGLREAPYVDCPASLTDWRAGTAQSAFRTIPLRIAAGLACRSVMGVADVMRGEETQLFGAIALNPALGEGRHRVILPGTHSKWVWLNDGRITRFRTFLTGELFGLLQGSSLLATPGEDDPPAEVGGFASGIVRTQGASGILGNLFEARAAQLRDGRSPAWAKGFLSGLIIGSEVAEMLWADPDRAPLTIIGDPNLAARYDAALGAWDATTERADGDACVLAGLGLLDADD